jgi:DNA modification methylase
MEIQKPKKSIKRGEIIELGQHRLLCGDSSDIENVKKLIGNNKVDIIITDPPYGVAYVESKADFTQDLANPKEIQNDQLQSEDEYTEFTEKWIKAVLPFLSKKNSIYIFNSDKMLFALKKAMTNTKVYFSQLLIWIKSNSVIGRLDYLPQHELIAYGWHGTHLFNKSKDKSVLFCPKPHKSSLHPTIKPTSLLRRLILNSSKTGNIIYDPFGGSGSTLIACENTKRKCFIAEIDPEYCETIIRRYNEIKDLLKH